MILSRLSRAIREQNWFAVAIEFLIVILGVVIGFQITAWNAERTARVQEAVILANLEEDFQTLVSETDDVIERTFEIARNATVVVEAIDSGVVPEDRVGQFEEGLISLVWAVQPPQSPSTLQELVSSGGLSRLSDADLRAALARFMERYEAVDGMANLLVEARFNNAQRAPLPVSLEPGSVADLERARESGAFLNSDNYRAAQGVRSTLEHYDLEALQADPALRDMFVASRDLNNTYLSWLVALRVRAQDVVDYLESSGDTP
ncbi:hypothetical protein L5876_08540 [Hyphobacterium sp. SN044]|uniref:hypothetical protein n=1 Tax=Hyphobacterium sp. SN044 TaxID=2912575 RepID=UPI001F3ABFA6|nr:hypothetical protein [Hyphobacterium sp. SN044]MCF8879858.1 hypothetical protein [Hyphobacterium sp. SN044]